MTSGRKSSKDGFSVRYIQEGDLDGAVELMKIENWFILERSKMDIIYQEQVATFYVVVDDNAPDKLLGIASVCRTREGEAMLGNVIIREKHRGNGLGTFIISKVLELHNDLNLTWFSAADQFYKNLGCQRSEQDGYFVEMTVDRDKVNTYCRENPLDKENDVIPFTDDQKDKLIQYDAKARGYASPCFVSFVIRICDKIIMAIRSSGTEPKIRGYVANCDEAAGTLYFNGFYADDSKIAAHLLRAALDTFPHLKKVRFFTLHSCQFLAQFGTPNMALVQSRFSSKGDPARIPEEKLFCLSEADMAY